MAAAPAKTRAPRKKRGLSEKTRKRYERWRKPEKPGFQSVISYRRNPPGKGARPRKRYT